LKLGVEVEERNWSSLEKVDKGQRTDDKQRQESEYIDKEDVSGNAMGGDWRGRELGDGCHVDIERG